MEKPEELGGSGNAFEDAASAVSLPERPEENLSPASTESKSESETVPISVKSFVDDDVAAWAAKISFWPLTRIDHPAWALTDEQAEVLGPHLRPHLQELIDKILPPSWNEYIARNKPLADLLLAYAAMLIIKRAEVKHAKRLEHADALIAKAKEEEARAATPPVPIDKTKSASPAFEFVLPKKPEETPAPTPA